MSETERPRNGVTLWRTIAVTLAGIVMTGASGWLLFAKDQVDRAEMVEYIANHAPYTRDKTLILDHIRKSQQDAAEAKIDARQIIVQIAQMQAQLTVVQENLLELKRRIEELRK